PDVAWRLPFVLRFDDSVRAFYNSTIVLDSVPVEGGSRIITGRHPAIALRLGTTVLIDGNWYALSQLEDFDSLELAKGTVGLMLEGKGEWADTLRAVQ
ncbi:MAG: hypothetical protein H7X80_11590, partial [bacterium]|nr:hypothetical protein [Candidatus Kapabacteria bacterium]